MNERVLNTLEYNKILNALTECAGSNPGKSMCRNLKPSYNYDWVIKSLDETDAALSRLLKNDRISFGFNTDVRALVKEISLGRTASIAELLGLGRLLRLTRELADYGEKKDDDAPSDALDTYFERLNPLPLLEKEISRCILSEDEIADEASSELSRIRKQHSATGDKIHSQLGNMVRNTYRSYLQDAVVTQRNNRYCLPVKAEYKNSVPGIVHDQSSTGSTLFIEPTSIVNLNNELKELELKERDEIARILTELSAKVALQAETVTENQKIITLLDFIFAKAKYALSINATKPIFNNEHRIRLRSARHPLLNKDTAVPISLTLGEDFDLLIVTGPNTGGKTVSLKTVGLLSLMGQSGLNIPALDRSELGFFKEIYADIGDEQSIEQSLSTFSSHMTGIVNILKNADSESLCLFDELGAGTDPIEGAALAIAILNHLHERGIRTMATTHYSELKIYALSTEFVENASCEFDVETLRPTYRLLLGIPGKSNAFAISGKLGLPEEIIENAKANISAETENFENVIADLEKQRIEIEKEKAGIEQYKKEIEILKNELDEKNNKLRLQKDKIIQEAREKARDILKEAKDIADDSIRAFNNPGSVMNIKTMEKKRAKLREQIDSNTKSDLIPDASKNNSKPLSVSEAVVGLYVHIVSMNMDGYIASHPDSKGNVLVRMGNISSKINISNLYKQTEKKEEPSQKKNVPKKSGQSLSKSSSISTEINVIGLTVDEAISKVDKYLDDACLSHVSKVRIVHGKGTGALRNAIHSYLRSCPYVTHYELAAYGEGDCGVTVVDL